jgi:phosphate transport system substrate-binding protein
VNIKRRPLLAALSLAAATALLLSGCGGDSNDGAGGGSGGQELSGPIVMDGSSTVQPLSAAAGELFKEEHPDTNPTVATSGTGGGFTKFCAGETDISNASRPIKDEEKAKCDEKGISFSELQVANDALTVVVNKDNTWAECLTVDQLKKIWEPNSEVSTWKQVDPSFPDEPLKLYGAGSDSGTFDYFTAEIVGEEGSSRTDYNPSEDDNVTVQGVAGAKGALGYFGFSYFEENQDRLKAVKIDGGSGCVEPSVQAAQDGSYTPLSRPLFIYPSDVALKKPQVVAFVEFYLEHNQEIVEAARFVPLTEEQKQKSADALAQLKSKAGA